MMLCTLVQEIAEDLDFLQPAGGHSDVSQNVGNYRISRTIRRTKIFSLDILEKNNNVCILILVNLLEENRIGTYQN